MSGISCAYVSEVAERHRALAKLEAAMVTNLQESPHGGAARWVPMLIALVNDSAPPIISLIILILLWMLNAGILLPLSPPHAAIIIALLLIFLLGSV